MIMLIGLRIKMRPLVYELGFLKKDFNAVNMLNKDIKREVITDAMLEEGYAKIALGSIEVHDLVVAKNV